MTAADLRCDGEQSVWFFPPQHAEPRAERIARESLARALCGVCPARLPCLERALDLDEQHGIWGGHTPRERSRMRRVESSRAG